MCMCMYMYMSKPINRATRNYKRGVPSKSRPSHPPPAPPARQIPPIPLVLPSSPSQVPQPTCQPTRRGKRKEGQGEREGQQGEGQGREEQGRKQSERAREEQGDEEENGEGGEGRIKKRSSRRMRGTSTPINRAIRIAKGESIQKSAQATPRKHLQRGSSQSCSGVRQLSKSGSPAIASPRREASGRGGRGRRRSGGGGAEGT